MRPKRRFLIHCYSNPVEGYPVHEPRFAGIMVYATQVTTKALQTAKRKTEAAPVNEG